MITERKQLSNSKMCLRSKSMSDVEPFFSTLLRYRVTIETAISAYLVNYYLVLSLTS